jgi:hypothetical protein
MRAQIYPFQTVFPPYPIPRYSVRPLSLVTEHKHEPEINGHSSYKRVARQFGSRGLKPETVIFHSKIVGVCDGMSDGSEASHCGPRPRQCL